MYRLPLRYRIELRTYPNPLDTSASVTVFDAIITDPNDCDLEVFRCTRDSYDAARADAESFIAAVSRKD